MQMNRIRGPSRSHLSLRGRGMPVHAAPPEAVQASAAFDAKQFLRSHLLDLAPYTPIEPFEILSRKLGRSPSDIIKLDANENPYGPPPEVLEALASMPFPHIYPDPECRALREELAELNNTPPENILVGCGADELIDLLLRCILEPGDAIIDTPPTFGMYAFDTDVCGGRVVTVPRRPDFSLDVPAITAAVEQHAPKALFLTSPNNPDGSMLPEADLLALLALPVLCVLDEAYVEFSGVATRMPWVTQLPNLVVLRTFSKSAGLAGLRVGYGAFPDELITYLWRAKQPYNVSVASETAALAALRNPGHMDSVRERLISERRRLSAALEDISFLAPYPSEANFVLCKVEGRDAQGVRDTLANDYGIMVRHYRKKLLDGFVRVSVGKPEQTDALIAALRDMEAGSGNSSTTA
eukprot:jgi/Ulvmu1/10950/UM007_0129.1